MTQSSKNNILYGVMIFLIFLTRMHVVDFSMTEDNFSLVRRKMIGFVTPDNDLLVPETGFLAQENDVLQPENHFVISERDFLVTENQFFGAP